MKHGSCNLKIISNKDLKGQLLIIVILVFDLFKRQPPKFQFYILSLCGKCQLATTFGFPPLSLQRNLKEKQAKGNNSAIKFKYHMMIILIKRQVLCRVSDQRQRDRQINKYRQINKNCRKMFYTQLLHWWTDICVKILFFQN